MTAPAAVLPAGVMTSRRRRDGGKGVQGDLGARPANKKTSIAGGRLSTGGQGQNQKLTHGFSVQGENPRKNKSGILPLRPGSLPRRQDRGPVRSSGRASGRDNDYDNYDLDRMSDYLDDAQYGRAR